MSSSTRAATSRTCPPWPSTASRARRHVVSPSTVDAWLPLPVCQLVVPLPGGGHYRIDFAYPSVKLAIEVDGPHHRLPAAQIRDARRDRRLRQLGWTVDRFDEEAVTHHPERVLDAIRTRLVALGVDVTPVPPPLPDLRQHPLDPWLVP